MPSVYLLCVLCGESTALIRGKIVHGRVVGDFLLCVASAVKGIDVDLIIDALKDAVSEIEVRQSLVLSSEGPAVGGFVYAMDWMD